MTGARILLALMLLAAIAPTAPAAARDYGRQGALFPIIEPDLLALIREKLLRMQASGATDRMNRELAARTAARVKRPAPVAGIAAASDVREWTHDPSIVVERDLRDAKGRVIIRRGTKVNPLDTVPLRAKLIFLDGDDPAQVAWAIGRTTPLDAKLILVKGSPHALMKAEQRRFYFDQAGVLTARLGIRAVPAVVEQRGRTLRLREIPLPTREAKQ